MPDFSRTVKLVADGCLAKPILAEFLSSNEPFSMKIETAKPLDRPPDGWFHASTHPGLTDDELLDYLRGAAGDSRDEFGYVGRLSVLFGTIMHEVVRQAWAKMGVSVPVIAGPCGACGLPQPRSCREHGAVDLERKARGHLDAILNLGGPGRYGFDSEHVYGLDFKTIKPMILYKAPDMDLDFFQGRWPKYWWQAQDYMRMTGLRRFIVLFMAMGNPWDMREYQLEYSPSAALQIEQKYERVRRVFEAG